MSTLVMPAPRAFSLAAFGPTVLRLALGAMWLSHGLVLKLMAGLQLVVDNEPVDLSKTLTYKGLMYSDVPNVTSAFGYTNASWTLKCDLTAEYICRILNYMDEHGFASATPRVRDPNIETEPALDFTSGYVQRALHELPKQGSKLPWKLYQNYVRDLSMLRYGKLEDGTMEFAKAPKTERTKAVAA